MRKYLSSEWVGLKKDSNNKVPSATSSLRRDAKTRSRNGTPISGQTNLATVKASSPGGGEEGSRPSVGKARPSVSPGKQETGSKSTGDKMTARTVRMGHNSLSQGEQDEEELHFQMDYSDVECDKSSPDTVGSFRSRSQTTDGRIAPARAADPVRDRVSESEIKISPALTFEIPHARREDYAYCEISNSAPSNSSPTFCNLNSNRLSTQSGSMITGTSIESCGSLDSAASHPASKSPGGNELKPHGSQGRIPRMLKHSISKIFPKSKAKVADSSLIVETKYPQDHHDSRLKDCSLTKNFVSESVQKGMPIIPFGYPTIALVERKFEETKSLIRKNSMAECSGSWIPSSSINIKHNSHLACDDNMDTDDLSEEARHDTSRGSPCPSQILPSSFCHEEYSYMDMNPAILNFTNQQDQETTPPPSATMSTVDLTEDVRRKGRGSIFLNPSDGLGTRSRDDVEGILQQKSSLPEKSGMRVEGAPPEESYCMMSPFQHSSAKGKNSDGSCCSNKDADDLEQVNSLNINADSLSGEVSGTPEDSCYLMMQGKPKKSSNTTDEEASAANADAPTGGQTGQKPKLLRLSSSSSSGVGGKLFVGESLLSSLRPSLQKLSSINETEPSGDTNANYMQMSGTLPSARKRSTNSAGPAALLVSRRGSSSPLSSSPMSARQKSVSTGETDDGVMMEGMSPSEDNSYFDMTLGSSSRSSPTQRSGSTGSSSGHSHRSGSTGSNSGFVSQQRRSGSTGSGYLPRTSNPGYQSQYSTASSGYQSQCSMPSANSSCYPSRKTSASGSNMGYQTQTSISSSYGCGFPQRKLSANSTTSPNACYIQSQAGDSSSSSGLLSRLNSCSSTTSQGPDSQDRRRKKSYMQIPMPEDSAVSHTSASEVKGGGDPASGSGVTPNRLSLPSMKAIVSSSSLQDFQDENRAPRDLTDDDGMRSSRSNSVIEESLAAKLTYLQKITQENKLNKKFKKANRNRGDYTLLDFAEKGASPSSSPSSHSAATRNSVSNISPANAASYLNFSSSQPASTANGKYQKSKPKRFFSFSK